MDSGLKRCGLSTEWAVFMDRRVNNKIFCDEFLSLFIKFLKRCTSACKYASKQASASKQSTQLSPGLRRLLCASHDQKLCVINCRCIIVYLIVSGMVYYYSFPHLNKISKTMLSLCATNMQRIEPKMLQKTLTKKCRFFQQGPP